jgi:hypothetical protein
MILKIRNQIPELFEIIDGARSRSVFKDWGFSEEQYLILRNCYFTRGAFRSYLCNQKMLFDKNRPEIHAIWNSPPINLFAPTGPTAIGSGSRVGLIGLRDDRVTEKAIDEVA